MTEDAAIPPDPAEAEAEAALLARLSAAGIPFTLHRHPPLRTVEDSRSLRGELHGVHVKNLFLKEKRRGFRLAVLEETRRVRIGDLARAAGARPFSFADEAELRATLGVRPGAVTPLALLAPAAAEVGLVLDAQVAEAETVNVHPLHNAATVALAVPDLLRLLAEAGHAPLILDLGPLDPAA